MDESAEERGRGGRRGKTRVARLALILGACEAEKPSLSVKTIRDNLLLWTLVQLRDTFVSLADKYARVNVLG